MIWLIQNFWENATMVCQASVNYSTPFQAGRSITQGGPLSAKLFNVLIDAVAREWLQELREGSALEPDKINHLMATFFAIFYVNDAYLASRDPDFLQRALNVIVGSFPALVLRPMHRRCRQLYVPLGGYAFNYRRTLMPGCVGDDFGRGVRKLDGCVCRQAPSADIWLSSMTPTRQW
jgi:hypothetical protein